MKFSHKTYEKLLDLVRERPALYNCQLTEYTAHQLQKNTWKNIAEEMGLEDMTGMFKLYFLKNKFVREINIMLNGQ